MWRIGSDQSGYGLSTSSGSLLKLTYETIKPTDNNNFKNTEFYEPLFSRMPPDRKTKEVEWGASSIRLVSPPRR